MGYGCCGWLGRSGRFGMSTPTTPKGAAGWKLRSTLGVRRQRLIA